MKDGFCDCNCHAGYAECWCECPDPNNPIHQNDLASHDILTDNEYIDIFWNKLGYEVIASNSAYLNERG